MPKTVVEYYGRIRRDRDNSRSGEEKPRNPELPCAVIEQGETEHEKHVFRKDPIRPVPYEGRDGIRALLDGIEKLESRPQRMLLHRASAILDQLGANYELEEASLDPATLAGFDLATDGGSKLNFVDAIRKAGAEIAHTFVIFHYGIFPEGVAALAEKGVRLHALATWWDALGVAEERGYLSPAQVQEVRNFLQDPETWSAAHGGRENGTGDTRAG